MALNFYLFEIDKGVKFAYCKINIRDLNYSAATRTGPLGRKLTNHNAN